MAIEPEEMLTIFVITLALLALTGWALAIYVMVSQERLIIRLRSDLDELDRDLGRLWQVTYRPPPGRHLAANQILPFIKRSPPT